MFSSALMESFQMFQLSTIDSNQPQTIRDAAVELSDNSWMVPLLFSLQDTASMVGSSDLRTVSFLLRPSQMIFGPEKTLVFLDGFTCVFFSDGPA